MSQETYAVIFDGEIVEGFTVETVKAQLEKLPKVDINKASALFSGKQIVLKKLTDRAAAKNAANPSVQMPQQGSLKLTPPLRRPNPRSYIIENRATTFLRVGWYRRIPSLLFNTEVKA